MALVKKVRPLEISPILYPKFFRVWRSSFVPRLISMEEITVSMTDSGRFSRNACGSGQIGDIALLIRPGTDPAVDPGLLHNLVQRSRSSIKVL